MECVTQFGRGKQFINYIDLCFVWHWLLGVFGEIRHQYVVRGQVERGKEVNGKRWDNVDLSGFIFNDFFIFIRVLMLFH